MSGTASVPNTFANAVTATGAQLDANYTTICAYVNDPTNRNNYAAAAGSATDTIALTFTPPLVGGYTAGVQITFRAANPNTGAVVLNGNGLGNVSLFSPSGGALGAGAITAGQMVCAAYDGTQFQMISSPANVSSTPASQAQMTAAASLTTFVTPGRQLYHPGMPKGAAYFNGTNTGTITALSNYGISSIVRLGAGTYTIALSTPMGTTNYPVIISASKVAVNSVTQGGVVPRTTAGFVISLFNTAGSAVDADEVNVMVLGAL